MRHLVRWNLSSRARDLSGGDAIVVSIPKSGRTWLRAFLCDYYCTRYAHEFTLNLTQHRDPRIPRVLYSHDRFEQRTKADLWDGLRGKYLIPAAERRRARIIFLVRDPRDTFVSLYLQLTHRVRETSNELRKKNISELLCDSRYGIVSMIEIMNGWLKEWSGTSNFLLVRYEEFRRAPEESFRQLLRFLDKNQVDQPAFSHALEFCTFENMKRLEAIGAFDSKILQTNNVRDPESFKVRRGKVGGYADYLQAADMDYATEAMRELDSRFGYGITASNSSSLPPPAA